MGSWKQSIPPKASSLSAGSRAFFFFFFWKDPLLFVLLNAPLIVKVTELNEKTKITAQQLKFPLIFGYKRSPWWKIDRAVFKWLSKNQNQSNYSDQSQMGQTAGWTNHNSKHLAVTCSKRGKNHAYMHMAWLVLVLLLIGWKTGASLLGQSRSVSIAIK